jgi:hypothetical protein
MRIVAALSVLVLAACAPTAARTEANNRQATADEAKLASALRGLVPGETSSCMPPLARTNYQTEAYGKTILYKVDRGLIYRSDTSGGCERIARDDILITRQFSGRQCAGDIATTVDRVARFTTGSCSFGPFTVYRRPPRS